MLSEEGSMSAQSRGRPIEDVLEEFVEAGDRKEGSAATSRDSGIWLHPTNWEAVKGYLKSGSDIFAGKPRR